MHAAATRVNANYEQRFAASIFREVRQGDCVWDIGANVGYYTEPLLKAVGTDGHVVAIEPSPASVQIILKKTGTHDTRFTLAQVALSSSEGFAPFTVRADSTSCTNRLGVEADGTAIQVRVTTGDALLGEVKVPTIIKLDVEGYELEVMRGMSRVLSSPQLRAVFIEVHSALLEKAGEKDAGHKICKILEGHGLNPTWVDFSHIVARRGV